VPEQTQQTLIRGSVAEILNSREVVINRGTRDGVRLGMKFAILEPKAQNVIDPETDETLGSVDRPKVLVRVVRVQERLAVARTFRSHRRNVGGVGLGGSEVLKMFEPPNYVREYETFRSDQATWEELDEKESFVKIGDPVEELFESEDTTSLS
jgi:hypothetical protein